ncbi:MAG: hypothetical protein OEN21_06925 [Myxococcales bacterium]|nr:hypothetical protein [Myxococcales bacterium]
MRPTRPGIASADRPRRGPFASLLDQILHDRTALDGLAFAYAELALPERHALVRAVLQDAADPTRALAALLAVEEEPSAQQRLARLIQRHGRVEQSAFLTGTEAQGEARLLQSLPSLDPESLCIAWKESKIKSIEIESRRDFKIDDAALAVTVSEAAETLAPLLWQHIRSGGQLPEGVERFAGFFSGASSP